MALRKAKIVCNFGLSECRRVKLCFVHFIVMLRAYDMIYVTSTSDVTTSQLTNRELLLYRSLLYKKNSRFMKHIFEKRASGCKFTENHEVK